MPRLLPVAVRVHTGLDRRAEVIAAIKKVVPDARVEVPTGEPGQQSYLDITRLQQDTGYRPDYDTERAVADYVAWLRAGNER